MQVKLVGIHSVTAKLADGSERTYRYAWRGGPRMETDPLDEYAFMAEFYRLTRDRQDAKPTGCVPDLVRAYRASSEYTKLKESTRRGYDAAIDLIEAEYHGLELAGMSEPGMRRMLLEWRDAEFADTPRKADLVMSVFALMLAFGLDREMVTRNPLEKLKRLSGNSRRDIIWSDAQMAAFLAAAPPKLRLAMELARWTGQRQGDLLRLTWTAYDGTHIKLRQGKTNRVVRFKVFEPLKQLLDATKREAVTILTPTRKRRGQVTSWTADGFRSSWAGVCADIKLTSDDDPTFHDLRGTFVTLAHRRYQTPIKEIAEITGHTERDAEAIIRKHYLAGDAAIERIEAKTLLQDTSHPIDKIEAV